MIVNCGTYAYQCKERSSFRSTAAHNTVMVNDTEQSQCWGAFRMAKRSKVNVISESENTIVIELIDQRGQKAKRTIQLEKTLKVTDESNGNKLTAFVHPIREIDMTFDGKFKTISQKYAPEYGELVSFEAVKYEGNGKISVEICI